MTYWINRRWLHIINWNSGKWILYGRN